MKRIARSAGLISLASLGCLVIACGSSPADYDGTEGSDVLPVPSDNTAMGMGALSVTWKTPLGGQNVSGKLTESTCQVDVANATKLSKVSFYLDEVLLNVDNSAPYGCAWDTATSAAGTHNLKAVAYDAAGKTASAAIDVQVGGANPAVQWAAPLEGATVQGVLNEAAANCRVDATAKGAIDRVEFYLDGTLLNTERNAPWSCSWDSSTAAAGSSHQLTAKAYDTAGGSGEASIQVTVGQAAVEGKRNFYVDSTRTTNGDGSAQSPWNDLASVNSYAFLPGDWIHLYGSFNDTIVENNTGGANEQDRIVYVGTGPYDHNGVRRAKISGIKLSSSSYITYRNLEASDPKGPKYAGYCTINGDCCSAGSPKLPESAVLIRNSSNPTLHHIRFENLYLHDGDNGAGFGGANIHDITFVDTEIDGMWRSGVVLNDSFGDGFSYLGGSITNTGGRLAETGKTCPHWHTHGIYPSGGHNHVFDGIRFENNADGSSLTLRRGDMTVRNNVFIGAPGAAMIGFHNEDETLGNRWIRVYHNVFAGTSSASKSSFYAGERNTGDPTSIENTNTSWAIFNNTMINTKVNFGHTEFQYSNLYFKNNAMKSSRLDIAAAYSSRVRKVDSNSWYSSTNTSSFADGNPVANGVDPVCAAPEYAVVPSNFVDQGTKSISSNTTITSTEWGGYSGNGPDVGRTER